VVISLVITASFLEVFPTMNQGWLIVVGAILIALYWTLQPRIIHKYMKKVTKSDDVGYGHTSSSVAYLAASLGGYIGNPKRVLKTSKYHSVCLS